MKWYKHPTHGFMLRAPALGYPGYDMVVTALCQNTLAVEMVEDLWAAHKSRLRVNAGCGALAVDMYLAHDRNPEFRPARKVPPWIVADFKAALE